jgi:hypothetical protein
VIERPHAKRRRQAMEQLTRELMTRSFLYDDPGSYEAGVRAALEAVSDEQRWDGSTESPAS